MDFLWPIALKTEVLVVKKSMLYSLWDAAVVFTEPLTKSVWAAVIVSTLAGSATLALWNVCFSGVSTIGIGDLWTYLSSVFLGRNFRNLRYDLL
jgi:hypothetical protein